MTLEEILSAPATRAGVSFLWTISLGQLITIAITLLGIFWAAAKFVQSVSGTNKKVIELAKNAETDRKAFAAALERMEERHREDIADCRSAHDQQFNQIRGSLDNLTQSVLSMANIERRNRSRERDTSTEQHSPDHYHR